MYLSTNLTSSENISLYNAVKKAISNTKKLMQGRDKSIRERTGLFKNFLRTELFQEYGMSRRKNTYYLIPKPIHNLITVSGFWNDVGILAHPRRYPEINKIVERAFMDQLTEQDDLKTELKSVESEITLGNFFIQQMNELETKTKLLNEKTNRVMLAIIK